MNQSLYHHSRYVAAIAPTGESLRVEEQWATNTEVAAHDAFKLIDDYLNTFQSDKAPNGGAKRPTNDQDDTSVVLAAAKKRRLAAGEALKATEDETNKKIDEIRRNSHAQRAELQGEINRQRALETSLETTNQRNMSGPDANSTPLDNRPETSFPNIPP